MKWLALATGMLSVLPHAATAATDRDSWFATHQWFYTVPLGTESAQQYHAQELPPICGKFPRLVPGEVWLEVDEDWRILWNGEPVDAKNLGPRLKRQKAEDEKTTNFVIGFGGIKKDAARKKFLGEILKRSGLAFSPPECFLIMQ